LNARVLPPSERKKGLPKAIDAVVLRALSRHAHDRYACVEDFGAALLAFATPNVVARWVDEFRPAISQDTAATGPPSTLPCMPEPRGRAAARKHGWALPTLLAIGVAAVVLWTMGHALATHGRAEASTMPYVAPTQGSVPVADTAGASPPDPTGPTPRTSVVTGSAMSGDPVRPESTTAASPSPNLATPKPQKPRPGASARRPVPEGHAQPVFDNGAPVLDPE
jgi:serine/threonine-protein kinase